MLSCKDVSHKLSEAQDRKLTIWERLAIKTHLLICDSCRTMERQIRVLSQLARQLMSADDVTRDQDQSLSDEAQARIRSRLKESNKNSH